MDTLKTPPDRAGDTYLSSPYIGVPPSRPLAFSSSLNRVSDFVSSHFSGTIGVTFVESFPLFTLANYDKIFDNANKAKVSNKLNNYIQT